MTGTPWPVRNFVSGSSPDGDVQPTMPRIFWLRRRWLHWWAREGSKAESQSSSRSLRPFTPPAALTWLKYDRTVSRSTVASTGPVSSKMPPTVMKSEVTPSSGLSGPLSPTAPGAGAGAGAAAPPFPAAGPDGARVVAVVRPAAEVAAPAADFTPAEPAAGVVPPADPAAEPVPGVPLAASPADVAAPP